MGYYFIFVSFLGGSLLRVSNYNLRVTRSTRKSSETELKYSKGLQGVSSQEKERKVCLFLRNVCVCVGGCMRLCASACAMWFCKGEVGGLGAEGEAMEGARKNRSHTVHACLMPSRRAAAATATPLSSHVGCRPPGTAARLPVRVAEGGGVFRGGGGQLSDICSAEAGGRRAPGIGRRRCWRHWHEAGWVQQERRCQQQAVDGLNGEAFAQTA